MKLLLSYGYLVSPKNYKINRDSIIINKELTDVDNKGKKYIFSKLFWEGEEITIIDLKNKIYKEFIVKNENQDSPTEKKKGLSFLKRIIGYFTNTIYVDANKWKIIKIPKNIKEKSLANYENKYINA